MMRILSVCNFVLAVGVTLVMVQADGPVDPGAESRKANEKAAAALLAELGEKHGYRLERDQLVRRIAGPFPETRDHYFRAGFPIQAQGIPQLPETLVFLSRGGRIFIDSVGYNFGYEPTVNGLHLGGLLTLVPGVDEQIIEGDEALRKTALPGDWIIRENAPLAPFLEQFERVIRQGYQLPVRLKYGDVQREVWIVSGEYKYQPSTNPLPSEAGFDSVSVFADELKTDGSATSGNGGMSEFLKDLQTRLGTQIVLTDELRSTVKIQWSFHDVTPEAAERVLNNVSTQIGLTFRQETRTVKRLQVIRE